MFGSRVGAGCARARISLQQLTAARTHVAGSIVSVKYKRGSQELTTSLVRACTTELADKKRMFELL